MIIPSGETRLRSFTKELVAQCRASQGQRQATYRQYGEWIETGSPSGPLAIANMLYSHIDNLHSHLFSPTDLRFSIDFESPQDDRFIAMGDMAAKILTREWERKNIDTTFGEGVKEALKYGACVQKQLVSTKSTEVGGREILVPSITSRLVMPWNFAVYNEGENDLSEQEAMVETVFLTAPQVWRRVQSLPDAEKIYKKTISSANTDTGSGGPTSFFHQVLSVSQLDTTGVDSATQPPPGGIVSLNNNPNFATIGPNIGVDLFPMHEVWVKSDAKDDFVTIQMIEPDIIIAGQMKRVNMFCPGHIPYTLIQPNRVAGYFWGRSEIVDLMNLQQLLSTNLQDMRRLMGVQFDKVLGFPGYDGLTDEAYDQMRAGNYFSSPPGSSIVDLTPKVPEQGMAFIKAILELMDRVSGFSNILSGRGEAGVRAGNHADTLMKTASPRLRDRALLVERQCATAGDQTLAALEAKDGRIYWVDEKNRDTDFLMDQLPEDRRVSVDSHSTSPIYQDDHQNLVGFGLKSDLIGKDDAIDMLPFPNRDKLKASLKKRELAQAEFVKQHPEVLDHAGKKK